ncbi:MAG: GH92 family glycosyl hydrolase [Bacteroidales bacterium]|nr:GH92 family glycosyl hydrolase [Bacteroidales bacterium]
MIIRKALAILTSVAMMAATGHAQQKSCDLTQQPAEYVSTLVGSLSDHSFSTGNTYPALALPWGMNFWTPVTGEMGDGWAYRYDAHQIRGFEQTHQPSPWINDYGQFAIMPVRDISKVSQNDRASWFTHKSETAKPYYYQVYLCDHDINAEIAPTERAAAFRFTYPESSTSGIIVDAYDDGSYIKVIPEENAVVGYTTKNSGGVPDNFRNWFVVKFDKPIESFTVYNGPKKALKGRNEFEGRHALASVQFKTVRGEKVGVRSASSFISLEQAWLNFKEAEGRDFEQIKEEARCIWNDVLGRIEVSGGTTDQYRTFYSCLYRSLLFPRKFYEINKEGEPVHYSPYNGQVCKGYLYTDTGFWDTFRALFPLLNLVYPSVNEEIQQGLANIARENDFLPEWASPGHRGCMVGNNSASVVAEAALMGLTSGQDMQALYECIAYGTENVHPEVSSTGRLGHQWYNTLGYIPYDVGVDENVARTLEYAYNDWCILQMAKKMGRPDEELRKWEKRSQNWKNVFDSSTNLMRGRNKDGKFQEPFSPYKWGDAFTEGNAWHYTWSVFHDVDGLIDMMGGEETFASMLDSVFVVPPIYDDSYYGFRIHEITEMQVANMGNYAHGNQPAQHMLYLYDWAGQPWKAQKWIREVMDRLYDASPNGYCGDEDNGQTSAWYVFSALGFYPVCPGSGQYALGTPLFREATVHLENGNELKITAEGTDCGPYVRELKMNGSIWGHNYLNFNDLIKGAELNFILDCQPCLERGTKEEDKPYSYSRSER